MATSFVQAKAQAYDLDAADGRIDGTYYGAPISVLRDDNYGVPGSVRWAAPGSVTRPTYHDGRLSVPWYHHPDFYKEAGSSCQADPYGRYIPKRWGKTRWSRAYDSNIHDLGALDGDFYDIDEPVPESHYFPFDELHEPQFLSSEDYQQAQQAKEDRAREIFHKCDADRNGFLDIYEFMQAMKALGQPMDFAAAKEVFSSWDTDESACIEEDEFVIAYCRNF
jgi:hypothetical protein|uniref:EF-hand domain-containing protein n=1 Tax=Eutreptiella gymnastica TaxID=73025 RepID=A0A7S4FY62_9EUGL